MRILEKPAEVIIKRSRWYRGKTGDNSRLASNNKQCCLGFWARTAGALAKDIKEIGTPADLVDKNEILLKGLVGVKENENDLTSNTKRCRNFMKINDDQLLTDDERELRLIKQAAEMKVKFIFED